MGCFKNSRVNMIYLFISFQQRPVTDLIAGQIKVPILPTPLRVAEGNVV